MLFSFIFPSSVFSDARLINCHCRTAFTRGTRVKGIDCSQNFRSGSTKDVNVSSL